MNRSARRKLAANAEALSVLMAASCLGYSKAGALGRIKDAGATKALEGAFASMLRQGGEPVVIQIGNEVANAFPFQSVPDVIFASLAKAWLAVGIDRAGRGTYAMRRLVIAGSTEAEERDIAEVAMLGELARELNVPGFPVGTTAGHR